MRRRTVVAYVAAATMFALAGCGGDDSDTEAPSGAAEPGMAQRDADGEAATDLADEEASTAEEAPSEDEGANERARSDDGQADGGDGGVISGVSDQILDRDIIYTIELQITTDDLDAAAEQAASIAQRTGGLVASERTSGTHATLTLRIPTEEHADAVRDLEELGEVTDRARSTEDVTQQVVDTESRIASQRQSIARIRTLLDEAEDLSDVIAIESELARREADLDSLLSRQERLENLASLATVTVSFHTPETEPEEDETTAGFVGGLKSGWNAFTDAVGVALTAVGAALPFLVLAALIAVPVWLAWNRRRRAPGAQPPPTTPQPPATQPPSVSPPAA